MHAESMDPQTCDVCGRHMLFGERTHEYVTPAGERHSVCDLCRTKAQRTGWVRADRVDRGLTSPAPPAERPRGFSAMVSKVAQRRRREPSPEPRPSPPRPVVRVRREGRDGSGETPERRIRRALDRFNRSEHRRTVEGLTRSLGEPKVAAVTPAEAPNQVRLTVAWNLSWYQWKVEFSGNRAAVRAVRNGKEVSELGPADRAWNARAGEDGRIQLRLGSNGGSETLVTDESA